MSAFDSSFFLREREREKERERACFSLCVRVLYYSLFFFVEEGLRVIANSVTCSVAAHRNSFAKKKHFKASYPVQK